MVQRRVYILHSSLGARPGAECSAAGTKEKRLLTYACPAFLRASGNLTEDAKNKKARSRAVRSSPPAGRILRHWFVQQAAPLGSENGRSWRAGERAVGGADWIV